MMVRAYIYLISFKDTNDIYIGKTIHQNIFKRIWQHKSDCCSIVHSYVKKMFNGDWSNVYIDIIDSVDMNEDLTHLLNHPLNIITQPKYNIKKYTRNNESRKDLSKQKLAYIEYFHIHNYNNDDKYHLINKKISNGYDVYDIYNFYTYAS